MDAINEFLASQVAREDLATLAIDWGVNLVAALAVFIIGRWVARALTNGLRRMCERGGLDTTLAAFFGSVFYIGLMVVIILTALGVLGVPTTNFLAILGAAGLAIGLALKDSLSNFAAGFMLVFFRPFKAGDFIEAAGTAGTVDSIRIFNTVLKTPDNRVITVPNSLIYADTITNYSSESTRRVDLVIGISYDDDIKKAFQIIHDLMSEDDRILKDPEPGLLLLELGASSVDLAVRPWVASSDYWTVRSDLLRDIKLSLEAAGLSIPYPQQDVHLNSPVAVG